MDAGAVLRRNQASAGARGAAAALGAAFDGGQVAALAYDGNGRRPAAGSAAGGVVVAWPDSLLDVVVKECGSVCHINVEEKRRIRETRFYVVTFEEVKMS